MSCTHPCPATAPQGLVPCTHLHSNNDYCRSEHARDGGVSGTKNVGCADLIASMLAPTGFWCHAHICIPTTTTVGASMLAMVAQTPRAFRQPTSSLTTIASMLAPTGFWCHAHICIPTTTTVGASMLAMVAQTPRAFRQPTSSLTTIASMLAPTGFWCHAHICIPTKTTVGAGLPAMAACQALKMLDVPASSRASSLPQGFGAMHISAFQQRLL